MKSSTHETTCIAFPILQFFIVMLSMRSAASEALVSPIYEYLKDLCPLGQLPLTSQKAVRTCAHLCPLGALCYKGVCCVPPPQCRHPSYRISTGFPCLPNAKSNCPDGSQCVSSSQEGMYICCSSKNIEKRPLVSQRKVIETKPVEIEHRRKETSSLSFLDSSQICPKTHPVIAHDGKSLVLCKYCGQGVCAKFRTSNVEVCCQSSNDICGAGSQILMDGAVPRDCNKKPCSKGYECSLTPSGLRLCCSLAQCPSGVLARSVCAAGCLRSEKCTKIQNEMWCCPVDDNFNSRKELVCQDGAKSTGEKCDPAFPECSQGAFCELNNDKTAHICCKRYTPKMGIRKSIIPSPPFTTTTYVSTTLTTEEPFPSEVVPNCQDPDSHPLMDNGLPYICAHLGDTCLQPGYICQESDIDDVFVCCTAQLTLIPLIDTFTTVPATTTATTTTEKPSEEIAKPTCPFSYMPSKNNQQEVQRCLTLLSFDCPFGYTCLPSSTTDSYLCCIRKPVI